jgi:hypothetical protein
VSSPGSPYLMRRAAHGFAYFPGQLRYADWRFIMLRANGAASWVGYRFHRAIARISESMSGHE